MLPSRSKRYVGLDGEIVRLELAANWQLVLVALLVLGLLAAIFPRKTLVDQLYAQKTLDDLTLSYVENLYRTNPQNADAALLLARTQSNVVDIRQVESLVLDLTQTGDLRQRNEARSMLLRTYANAYDRSTDATENQHIHLQFEILARGAQHDELPERLAQRFGELAFRMNLPRLGLAFYKKLPIGQSADSMERMGDLALSVGQNEDAAEYYLLARERASTVDESRRLFQLGIRTLMAGNLYARAMQVAHARLGDLAEDRLTLRFLARTALAAGDPTAAADYARKLVFK